MYVANGSMSVTGNLDVSGQTSTCGLKVFDEQRTLPIVSTAGNMISFKKACEFYKPVQFNNGQTIIGYETTYNSAYVGSPTIQAGDRLVIGDSLMKIVSSTRKIVADTFDMTLARMSVNTLSSITHSAQSLNAVEARVSGELIAQDLFADTIKTNKLYLDTVATRALQTSQELSTKDLIVSGTAKVNNNLVISGSGSTNGSALTVNGGPITANKGIVSHTGNNRFQTLEIFGSGENHAVCFKIGKNVDSLIEGDVTIQDSKLVLDNSKLVTDSITITRLDGGTNMDETTNGIQISSGVDWTSYQSSMLAGVEPQDSYEDDYDPIQSVSEARERNQGNYSAIDGQLKDILNPITYLMERENLNLPKKFSVRRGMYKIDTDGHMLMKGVVAERGVFSRLEAFDFKVNKLTSDKLVMTSLAANVVDTDNLLKSRGIAEFDGVVNTAADVFVEDGSNVNVASGANVTFNNGAKLVLKNGAKFEMGTNTTVKMSGDIELDIDKLVFVDKKNDRKFKISFRDANVGEGCGIVMDYNEVVEDDSASQRESIEITKDDAKELDEKLKSLGI